MKGPPGAAPDGRLIVTQDGQIILLTREPSPISKGQGAGVPLYFFLFADFFFAGFLTLFWALFFAVLAAGFLAAFLAVLFFAAAIFVGFFSSGAFCAGGAARGAAKVNGCSTFTRWTITPP